MIPVLWSETETEFGNNIICHLGECITCRATEGINDIYEVEFQYPVWGKYFSQILEGRFIGTTHDDKSDVQPFEIYKRSAPIDGIVTFYAHHLSYKASRVVVKPIEGASPAGIFNALPTQTYNNCPFTFWTTKSGNTQFESLVPTSLRSILLGKKDSLVDTFGGEFEFNKWQIKWHGERGSQTDVTIRYGKNLTDLEQTSNSENLYNAIVPYWSGKIEGIDVLIMPDEGQEVVTLQGVTNPRPIVKDLTSDFKNAPDPAALISRAREYLTNDQPWVPTENLKINFTHLWQTEEYKNVASLQRVALGDKVSVYYPELGVTAENFEVVKVVYNVLEDKYDQMELGMVTKNFMEKFKEDYDKQIAETVKGFESILESEIKRATELLMDPGDSHVIFAGVDENGARVYGNGTVRNPQEILIMNTTDPATATQILRINKNGIGFATNINGPYRSAWTLDGHFIADFITAGTINGNLIRTGIISDYNTDTYELTSDTSLVAGKAYYIRAAVPNYDENSTYAVGDLVRRNGTVYKCTTAITTAESWTASHWTTAGSQDYTYVLVNTPMPNELGSYYEVRSNHNNYWNLETGEFRLSATTKVGNSTVASQGDIEGLVVSTDVEYGNSSSANTPPTTWTTHASWEKGKYLWTRVKMVLEDGTVQYTDARKIANGDGIGVSGVTEQYYLSTSNVTQTGGAWSDTQPTWSTGKYYWTRSKIDWADGSTTYTDPVLARALTSGNQSTDDLDISFNQQKIFNRLTNNGQIQGIFMEGGDLYINASYIKSGYLESSRIRITDLMQVMFDSETCGTLGAGRFYKTRSQSPSMYLCQGVGLSADSTIDDNIGHGVIAIDFDYGSPLIYGPHIDIRTDGNLYFAALGDVSINGYVAFSGTVNIGDATLIFVKGFCTSATGGSGSGGGGGGGSSYDNTEVWNAIRELQSESRTAVFG